MVKTTILYEKSNLNNIVPTYTILDEIYNFLRKNR